jgi:hypothetical protein
MKSPVSDAHSPGADATGLALLRRTQPVRQDLLITRLPLANKVGNFNQVQVGEC